MEWSKKQIAYNRTPRREKIRYIVIHDTGNKEKGANARSHFAYFSGGNRGASADFFVDDREILQINDYYTYCTWHCGDGGGKKGITNQNSLGIELCINSDGNYEKAFQKTVWLTKVLMAKLSISKDNVVRHFDASGKNCPASMRGDNWALWKRFKDNLEEKTMEETVSKKIDALTKRVQALESKMIYNYIDNNMPTWARKTVQKLVDKGYLQGDDQGLKLDDTMLRLLVIHDRMGLYDKN